MNSVGLHFGHDASICLMAKTGIQSFMAKERASRCKHAMGLSTADLRACLDSLASDTPLGLSTTQEVPLFCDAEYDIEIEGGIAIKAADFFASANTPRHYRLFTQWDPAFMQRSGVAASETLFPFLGNYNLGADRSYECLGMVSTYHVSVERYFKRPSILQLDGQRRTGFFYSHHYLHAQYASWSTAAKEPAVVITYDGGDGPSYRGGGIYFYWPDKPLIPVVPTNGWLGQFYDGVAMTIGFGAEGGAGKLMGLAPYGRPTFFRSGLIGTRYQVTDGYRLSIGDVVLRWLQECGIDGRALAWKHYDAIPPQMVCDVAASAQVIVELNMLELFKAVCSIAKKSEFPYRSVCLAGGLALNCPSNSNLTCISEVPVLVPPAVNDEGLSIGGAVKAFYDAHGEYPMSPNNFADGCYLGHQLSKEEVQAAAKIHGYVLTEGSKSHAISRALDAILNDTPIGLAVGKSEVGPRALGHRSIIADPRSLRTWRLVNEIKAREPWRPFAPVVLKGHTHRFFDRGPGDSRYMLFNYRCITKDFPAITHFDHSSRIQEVSEENGLLFDLLVALLGRGKPPVLLNTSFNGKGTPIVENADDCFAEALRMDIASVLTEFGLYAKKPR